MNNRSEAIALKYDKYKDNAPRILASGVGYTADQIIKIAKENNIEIVRDELLANSLINLNIGSYIPFETYYAVAEIIKYVYALKNKMGE